MFAEIGCEASWTDFLDVCYSVRAALGDFSDDFDVQAIAYMCYDWVGGRMVSTETWESPSRFWACAERFYIGA